MFNKIKTAAVSALIGLSAISATPAFAQDGELGIYFRDGNRNDYRDDYRHREYRGRDRWARSCTPDRALDKAARMGIHRARIADVDRRTITVRGRSRGERVFVTFARAPRCPIIG